VTKDAIINIIRIKALSYGLDPDLVLAIAQTESSLNPWCVRFEPTWLYYYLPAKYASKLGITTSTERNLQSTSFGLMQVMGGVARELGFDEELVQLCDPELGIQYGCLKLVEIKKRYSDEQDIISAYNGGSISKNMNGKYGNQSYVDKVTEALLKLRSMSQSVG
jgi:soluble lytic murein transglycosylase-like protein